MKVIIIILLGVSLSACNSSSAVKTHSKPNPYTASEEQRVVIVEIEPNKYRLKYNALLKETLQDAQDKWINNASEICNNNDFTYKITKQGFVTDYNEQSNEVSADLSGLCVTGGAVGCIIASLFGSDDSSNSTRIHGGVPFAAVEGLVTCKVK